MVGDQEDHSPSTIIFSAGEESGLLRHLSGLKDWHSQWLTDDWAWHEHQRPQEPTSASLMNTTSWVGWTRFGIYFKHFFSFLSITWWPLKSPAFLVSFQSTWLPLMDGSWKEQGCDFSEDVFWTKKQHFLFGNVTLCESCLIDFRIDPLRVTLF